jgi:hypothetical protein
VTQTCNVIFLVCIFENLDVAKKAEGGWFHKGVITLNTIYRLVVVTEIQFFSCELQGVCVCVCVCVCVPPYFI